MFVQRDRLRVAANSFHYRSECDGSEAEQKEEEPFPVYFLDAEIVAAPEHFTAVSVSSQ